MFTVGVSFGTRMLTRLGVLGAGEQTWAAGWLLGSACLKMDALLNSQVINQRPRITPTAAWNRFTTMLLTEVSDSEPGII